VARAKAKDVLEAVGSSFDIDKYVDMSTKEVVSDLFAHIVLDEHQHELRSAASSLSLEQTEQIQNSSQLDSQLPDEVGERCDITQTCSKQVQRG
jgi:hypothetical protein